MAVSNPRNGHPISCALTETEIGGTLGHPRRRAGGIDRGECQGADAVMESDESLMEAAGRGDLAAFERLVRRHQTTAWKIALRLLGNAADAEEIAQEAFLRLLEAAPRYRPQARFTTFLYRITSRLCIDHLRRRPPPAADSPEPVGHSPAPPEAALRRERDQAIAQALAVLPPRQRLVIVLRYFEGLAGEEIAEIAGTNPKAVERLLARGRTALEAILRPLIEP